MDDELKEEIWAWIRRRFWLGAAVLSLVTLFGGKSLVEWTVEKRVEKELEHARQATYEADMAGRMAKDRAGEAMDAVKNVQAAAVNTRAQLEALRQEIEREGTSIRGLISKDVDLLKVRLAELEKLVSQLAEAKGTSAQELATYRQKLATVEKEAQERDARFLDNTKYRVNIYFNGKTRTLAQDMLGKLTARGFKAAVSDIREAQQSLAPAQTQAPLVYSKGSFNLELLESNVMTYTDDVKKDKVDDLLSLLSDVLGTDRVKVYTREFFVTEYGSPFVAQTSGEKFTKSLFEIYLVTLK
jgi:hypothetical protein